MNRIRLKLATFLLVLATRLMPMKVREITIVNTRCKVFDDLDVDEFIP